MIMQTLFKLVIGLNALALSTLLYANEKNYSIYINAGSTGTRLHLIQHNKTASIPVLKDVFSIQTHLALTDLNKHPEKVKELFTELLNDTKNYLFSHHIPLNTVPIHLLATGGMRLLPIAKQQAIYHLVSQFVQTNYAFNLAEIKTITGKMEGFYGWLDINYLLNHFQNSSPTFGSLDMGGASTQIVFATDEKMDAEDKIAITINHRQYQVFSKSFSDLGQDQALKNILIEREAQSCFPINSIYQDNHKGYFNSSECKRIYEKFILAHQVRESLPKIKNQTFIAYSGVYYTYAFFKANLNPVENYLEKQIQTTCNKTWEQLQIDYPDISSKYLTNYCAHGIYYQELLYKHYNLKDEQIKISNKLKDQEIDWTLGAAFYDLIKA